MKRIAIIPAAGLGSRWGRYPKFILPCGERQWMLDRTILSFPDTVEKIIIVYSPETLTEITFHLHRTAHLSDKVMLVENTRMDLDWYGSVLAAMQFEADYYYFAMPDTYFDASVFKRMVEPGITLGVHWTETPERFGVIRDNQIVDKQPGPPGLAWGTLGWDLEVRNYWLAHPEITTYPQAINAAAKAFPKPWLEDMEFYKDFANWQEYVDFILWKTEGV